MKPIKIERVIHYEGGLERRSHIDHDENGNPVKPDTLSQKASKEWDRVWKWFERKGLEHLIDGATLRDHCLQVCHGERDECPDELSNIIRKPKKRD